MVLFWMLRCSAISGQTVSEQYLLAAANADRLGAGLPALQSDPALEQAARGHARAMAVHGNISHRFEGEPDLVGRAGNAGARFSLVTENVAEAPTSATIHELWMQSAGHRANLLDPQVNRIGIAVVAVGNELYAVEDFARSVERLSPEQQEETVAGLLAGAGLSIVDETAAARQTCTMKSGYAGRRRPWFVIRYTASSLARLPDELSERLLTHKYHEAAVGACLGNITTPFTRFNLAVLLYP